MGSQGCCARLEPRRAYLAVVKFTVPCRDTARFRIYLTALHLLISHPEALIAEPAPFLGRMGDSMSGKMPFIGVLVGNFPQQLKDAAQDLPHDPHHASELSREVTNGDSITVLS